jgi:hypothetical protein
MRRFLLLAAILITIGLFVWSANKAPLASPAALSSPTRGPAPAETPSPPCEACGEATLAAALTQEQISLSALQAQATATADILRSHALATSNAVAATQGAALTQAVVNANAQQAQAAATADILRAHTLATANAEAATQSAAQTQTQLNVDVLEAQAAATADRLQADTLATAAAATATQSARETEAVLQQSRRLQLTSSAATQNAEAAAAQQKMDREVSGTATAVARAAFHAQSDLTQRPEPSALLWMWLTPLLVIAATVFALWGATRWLAQRRTGVPSRLPFFRYAPPPAILHNLPPATINTPLPPARWPQPGEKVAHADDLTEPDRRQVRGWLADVKQKLLGQQTNGDGKSDR